jgi:hypothetical protein
MEGAPSATQSTFCNDVAVALHEYLECFSDTKKPNTRINAFASPCFSLGPNLAAPLGIYQLSG